VFCRWKVCGGASFAHTDKLTSPEGFKNTDLPSHTLNGPQKRQPPPKIMYLPRYFIKSKNREHLEVLYKRGTLFPSLITAFFYFGRRGGGPFFRSKKTRTSKGGALFGREYFFRGGSNIFHSHQPTAPRTVRDTLAAVVTGCPGLGALPLPVGFLPLLRGRAPITPKTETA